MKERPILFSGPMVAAILAGRKTQTRRLVAPKEPLLDVLPSEGESRGRMWVGLTQREPEARGVAFRCRYGVPGDRLWCREAHAIVPYSAYRCSGDVPHRVSPCGDWWAVYRAGWERCAPGRWRPSIHMPRWASRLTLEITDVRVERANAISADDARAEGIVVREFAYTAAGLSPYIPREHFRGDPDEVVERAWGTEKLALGVMDSTEDAALLRHFRRAWNSLNAKRGFPFDGGAWVWVLEFRRCDDA